MSVYDKKEKGKNFSSGIGGIKWQKNIVKTATIW